MRLAIRLAVLSSLVTMPLLAHHGKDFLLVESYELPHPHAAYAVSAEEFLFGASPLTFRVEPSLLSECLLDSDALHAAVSAEYEIGRHGTGNTAAIRFIVGHSVGEGAVVGNIGVERDRESSRAIYAVGYRPDIEGPHSWGVEAQGALHRGEQHEAIVAGYRQINERLTIKAGIGSAVGAGKPLALIRIGVVWRF